MRLICTLISQGPFRRAGLIAPFPAVPGPGLSLGGFLGAFLGLLLGLFLAAPALGDAPGLNYRNLVDRIEASLRQAEKDYRTGHLEAAKTAVQTSYFEIFENLEGPIRVNVSARRSYELEAEFGAIRKLMMEGAPPDEIAARIDAQIAAIDALVPVLEEGFALVAEPGAGTGSAAPSGSGTATEPDDQAEAQAEVPALPQTVEPYWDEAVAAIRADLEAAADALEAGDADRAETLILRAQFEGYKNSLLETAIRRHVSQQQDIAYNAEFARVLGLVEDGRPATLIRGSARVLTQDLRSHLPGLPLVGVAREAAEQEPVPAVAWRDVADRIDETVTEAIDLNRDGRTSEAVARLQDTYFDVFEASGMESRIGARDPAFKARIEARFSKLMALFADRAEDGAIAAEADALRADLATAVERLGAHGETSALALFGYALLIILREGFEAILIVTAIIAYLVRTGHADKQRVIVNSVVVALIASLLTAVLLQMVFRASAASRELLEGVTMLAAAVILFSMSYWLISKAEAARWSAYIKGKVQASLSSGSMKALWFTSFLAVYREGAETVVFYQALTTDTDTTGLLVIAGGLIVGCLALAVVYWAMRAGALRLPIRPFFQITGALLYVMAFIFIGKGVMELAEGKILTPTLIAWAPEIPALGLYPYLQSLVPQLALVAAALLALGTIGRRRRPVAVDASAGREARQEPGGGPMA